MNICIIGDGLTSLSLAQNLVNKKINVHIFHENKIDKLKSNRTIGISKNNLDFFRKEIQSLQKKNIWAINKIEIYSEKLNNKKILNFEKKASDLFYMIRNDKLYQSLNKKLSKNKFFRKIKIKDNDFYQKLMKKENYNLIINCIPNNFLAKKYFSKKIKKNYFNIAYTAMLEHEKLDNKTAIQFFTKFGPIAFLPISDVATSVVLSLDVKKKVYSEKEIIDLIKKFNTKLKIKKISKLESFRLELSNLRNYHYKNILAFGDFLHRIHPLAGQGFNMNIRDINILSRIIQNRIDLGMQLDSLICEEFEKKTKYKNFLFSNGVDFIYEFFNFDKENNNKNLSQILEFIGKKNFLNNALISYADNGMLDQ